MKPISFLQQNRIIAKDQPPYLPLPAYVDKVQGGRTITCWNLTFIERLKILFTGRIWVYVLNFNKPLQPQKLMVDNLWKK